MLQIAKALRTFESPVPGLHLGITLSDVVQYYLEHRTGSDVRLYCVRMRYPSPRQWRRRDLQKPDLIEVLSALLRGEAQILGGVLDFGAS